MSEEVEKKEQTFSVYAEAEGHAKPLILIGLHFARLIDDIVLPYEEDEPFFIDGVPLTRNKIKRLKIIKEADYFEQYFYNLHVRLRKSDDKKIYGEQYDIRMLALLREAGEDVTSQIIKAYSKKIKPSIKNYLPKREELIQAAMRLFVESIKTLGTS